MSFKFAIGLIQIIFAIILIVGMVLGLTMVRSVAKKGVDAGSTKIPSYLKSSVDLTMINKVVISVSILFGIIGLLFLFQGVINLKHEEIEVKPSEKTETKKGEEEKEVDLSKNIPDEY